MQCQPMRCAHIPFPDDGKCEKETIHSGHFMVSDFEAEAQDDEYEVAVPVPEARPQGDSAPQNYGLEVFNVNKAYKAVQTGQLAIETSLTKLFQCMSLAYRQKLTSPKWNRFKGIRLRWKDKIRLNNVIWRCWHMQFIKRQNTLICQFASPLDEGIHNKPEAVVLEGKYWKRKLAAVTAEYKKWRMFYRNKIMGWAGKDCSFSDMDMVEWQSQSNDGPAYQQMMVDEDYMDLMSDTLFSTISSNQPFAFPDIREIARGASLADFIQPSLVQLQPNLDDFMDTLEPLQEFFSSKLPPVPEDCAVADATYRPMEVALPTETRPPAIVEAPLAAPTSTVSYNYQDPKTSQYKYSTESAEPAVQTTKYSYSDQQAIKTARVYLPNKEPAYGYPAKSGALKKQDSGPSGAGDGFGFGGEGVESPSFTPVNPTPTVVYRGDAPSGSSSPSIVYRSDGGDGRSFSAISPTPSSSPRTYKTAAPPAAAAVSPCFGYQYQKITAGPSGSGQQFYDLASCLPESAQKMQKSVERSASLPSVAKEDVFAVPKMQLKSRHRSRSGSSLITGKSRSHPPPLLSSNSDPNLNRHHSALLAQLLTTASPGMYNVTNVGSLKAGTVPILPMPPASQPSPSTLLITTGTIVPAPQGYLSNVRHPTSPESPPEGSRGALTSPPATSPLYRDPASPKRTDVPERNKTPPQGTDHRRTCHINAEQKRRYNIRNGFEMLHSLIPHLQLNPNVKLSKAAMLQKGAEYIRQLQTERTQAKEEIEGLHYQIECLNSAISNCQSLLPATGAPVSRHRTSKMKEMFDEWVRARTLENWRFWVFSILFEPLLTSFNCSVSTASYEDLYRSTLMWVEQHCSLVNLRPAVLNSLRSLSTSTEILTDPQKLAEEAREAVSKKNPQGRS